MTRLISVDRRCKLWLVLQEGRPLANPGNIALVTSDDRLSRSLTEQLRLSEGLSVSIFAGGAAALNREGASPDLWLIDQSLADMPGMTLIAGLRTEGVAAPMLLLAAAGDPEPEPESGPDDTIARPWRLRFLLSRIETHLANRQASARDPIRIGPYDLRPAEKLLTDRDGDRRIRLTEKEVAILQFLAAASEPISRDILLNEVWGYQSGVTSHTLETHVYRLRQKLEADPSNAAILVNEDGGYRVAS